MSEKQVEAALRWRLMLGRHAEEHLPLSAAGLYGDLAERLTEAEAMDLPLEFIYDREHAQRAHQQAGPGGGAGLTVPRWLSQVRRLFPAEAVRVIEHDALVRYGMDELVTDAQLLREAEPTEGLLHAILQFKHMMDADVLEAAKQVVRAVVAKLSASLETDCRPALLGPRDPHARSPLRTFKNTDWRRTIRRNLRNYDTAQARLVPDRVYFHHRSRQRSAWRIIVAVDQSGSMLDSLVHASVMAAIFAALPAVTTHLVLWDHRVVDVSHLADDPVEVLLSCQLGGGTKLLPALRHCAELVTEPQRTILAVISDWHLFGERAACLAMAKELREAGIHGIGLCALDADANEVHDEGFARALAGTGWFVASMTPKQLAEHVGRILA